MRRRRWHAKLEMMSNRLVLFATLDGYSVEGGFDEGSQPSTCFRAATALGQIEGPSSVNGLWTDFERVLDAAVEIGLGGIRLTMEWARLEPYRGEFDSEALSRYRKVLSYARTLGLRTAVATIDATWPSWLGPEAWLLPWVAPLATQHIARIGNECGDLVEYLVPFVDAEGLVTRGFITEKTPPFRRGAVADAHSARRQIAVIERELRADDTLRELLRPRHRDVPAVIPASAMREVLDSTAANEQIHLRSLVRGSGPTASASGLLERRNGVWVTVAPSELIELLRS